jgi:hypothetical protein
MADRNARVWNGTVWESISAPIGIPNAVATYQTSSPSSPVTGQIWVNSTSDEVFVWSGVNWEPLFTTNTDFTGSLLLGGM